MATLTRGRGESIDLGGGISVLVTHVGKEQARFRVTLPPGVLLRRAHEPPPPARPPIGMYRPGGRPHRGGALTRTVGFALFPGGSVIIGDAMRFTLGGIETAGGNGRVARVAVVTES
jgi:hypothetical protein